MKQKLLKPLLVLLLLALCFHKSDGQLSIKDGLLAFYNFNGNTRDTSGNGKHATAQGGSYTTGRLGEAGTAFNFDGNAYINAPALKIDSTNKISYCIWVKANAFPTAFPYISSLIGTEQDNKAFFMRLGDSNVPNNKVQLVFYNQKFNSNKSLNAGTYYFIVATYDGLTMKIYINGELDSQMSYINQIGSISRFEIGHISTIRKLNGAIDEARVYCRALTDNEIKMLYTGKNLILQPLKNNNILTKEPLSINWSFNKDSITSLNILFSKDNGTTWNTIASNITSSSYTWVPNDTAKNAIIRVVDSSNPKNYQEFTGLKLINPGGGEALYFPFEMNYKDSSSNAYNGTAYNMSFSNGYKGQAADFSGTNAYISTPSFEIGGAFSLSTWVYVRNIKANFSRFIDFSNGMSNNNLILSFNSTSGKMYYELFNGGISQGTLITEEVFPENQWVHIALTVSSVGQTKIYWNGQLKGSKLIAPIPNVSRNQHYLGKSAWADAYFNGKMDEFKIYKRELTEKEISFLAEQYINFKNLDTKTIPVNEAFTISWNANKDSISAVNLLFSKNNGLNWDTLVKNLTDTFFIWQTPKDTMSNVSLKIESSKKSAYKSILSNLSIVENKLLLYYNFDRNTKDSGPQHYNLLANSIDFIEDRNNRSNAAANFSDSKFLQIPSFEFGGEMTLGVWINTSNPNRNYQRIIDFSNGMSNYNVIISFEGTSGKIYAEVFEGNTTNSKIIRATNPIEANKWVYVALTVQKDGKSRLYINGNLDSETYLMPISKRTRAFHYIGKSAWPGDAYFEGKIDQFSLYNRAFNTCEVKDLMKKTDKNIAILSENQMLSYNDSLKLDWYYDSNNIQSLNVLYSENNAAWKPVISNFKASNLTWKMPFTAATDLKIRVENAQNSLEFADYIPSKIQYPGYYDRVLHLPFNGNLKDSSFNQYVFNSNKIAAFAKNQFNQFAKALKFDSLTIKLDEIIPDTLQTVGFWMKTDSRNQQNVNLFDFSNHWLRLMNDSLLNWNVAGTTSDVLVSNVKLADSRWHYIACKYTKDSSFLFVDGNLQDSSNIVPLKNKASLTLGGYMDNGTIYRPYLGLMDEFSVYRKAFGAKEIWSMHCMRPDTLNTMNDISLCAGLTTTLTATGNAKSYNWNNGIVNGQTFTPAKTSDYIVNAIFDFGCIAVDTVKVTIFSLPIVNAGDDKKLCLGQEVVLTANTTAQSFNWNNDVSNGVAFKPTQSKNYILSGIDANGCTNKDTVLVTVNSLPVVYAGKDTSICKGENLSLKASGALTYTWDNNINNGATFRPTETKSYVVTGKDINGCQNTDTILVTVNILPVIIANHDTAICLGEKLSLLAKGASNLVWNNNVLNGIAFSPIESKSYIVTGTNTNGCKNFDTVLVTINKLPKVFAGNDTVICKGQSIVLNASGAQTLSWNNNLVNGSILIPSTNSEFIVSGTDQNGCKNKDTFYVKINVLPIVNAGNDLIVCKGENVTLTASGANVYSWNNSISNGVAFNPFVTKNYIVSGKDGNGCQNTDTVLVTVNDLPIIIANADTSICKGETVKLTANGAGSIIWNNNISNGISFSPTETRSYIATGTNENGCKNYDTVFVFVNQLPNVLAGNDTTICKGQSIVMNARGAQSLNWSNNLANGSSFVPSENVELIVLGVDQNGCKNTDTLLVKVNAIPSVFAGKDTSICFGEKIILKATGVDNLIWNQNIQNGVEFTPIESGIYIVNGRDVNGCKNSDTINVKVNSLPSIYAGADVTICKNKAVTLKAESAFPVSWNKGISDGKPFIATSSETYIATVIDQNQCTNTDTLKLTVEICSGIDSENTNEINVFPSLTKGIVTIETDQEFIEKAFVYNQNGQLVNLRLENSTLDFGSQPSGIYFIKIVTDKKVTTRRIMKQ